MPVLTPTERVGTLVVEKYRLDSIIGRGGMGVVYSATHEWTGRPVAVKFLTPDFSSDRAEEVARRFLQEARAAAKLNHPNVVDVLDMGQDADGGVYMVLERLRGETLEDIIRRERSLSPQEALDILLPIMDAVGEAHEHGIVHRDLKPSNIFLSDQRGKQVPKLLDFGVAKMRGKGAAWKTSDGSIYGTPHYMAPEQARAQDVGPASDVWALGVVLYRCLTGVLPFDAESPAEVLMKVMTEPAPSMSEVAPAIPASIGHAVEVALRPDPIDRHIDMAAFAEALRTAAADAGTKVTSRVRGRVHDNTDPSKATDVGLAATTPAKGSESDGDPSYAPPTKILKEGPKATTQPTAKDIVAAGRGEEVQIAKTQSVEEFDAMAAKPTTPFHWSHRTPSELSTPAQHSTPKTLMLVGLGVAVMAAIVVGLWTGFSGDDRPELSQGAAETSFAEQSVAEQPVAEQPVAEQPVVEEPVEEQPVEEQPAETAETQQSPTETEDIPESENGFIAVTSNRPCDVRVDGVQAGRTPIARLALPAGEHELSCRRPGEPTERARLTVAVGDAVEHRFRFARQREVGTAMTGSMLTIGRDYD